MQTHPMWTLLFRSLLLLLPLRMFTTGLWFFLLVQIYIDFLSFRFFDFFFDHFLRLFRLSLLLFRRIFRLKRIHIFMVWIYIYIFFLGYCCIWAHTHHHNAIRKMGQWTINHQLESIHRFNLCPHTHTHTLALNNHKHILQHINDRGRGRAA